MMARVGLHVSQDAVRAVLVRGRRVVWAGEAGADQLGTLLTAVPVSRWLRPTVSAAVGLHGAHVKRVAGLPNIPDVDALAAIIRENAGSFFLRHGRELVTSGVRCVGPGIVLSAAFEADVVDAVEAACRARHWRLARVAPLAVALAGVVAQGASSWTDGNIVLEIEAAAGRLTSVRSRICGTSGSASSAPALAALATLGPSAGRYAAAYGATLIPVGEPLALGSGSLAGSSVGRKLARPAMAAAISGVALLLSPLATYRAASSARHANDELRSGRMEIVARTHAQLAFVTAILEAASDFRASRTSVSQLLAGLGSALPDSSVLAGFDLRGDSVELQLLATRPAAALTAIGKVPMAGAAELVGSVRRDASAGTTLQRLVVRFEVVR